VDVKTGLNAANPSAAGMRKVVLIYNPASGQHFNHRAPHIEGALDVLRGAGIEADAIETTAPGTAFKPVLQALQNGCDAILACGGDGTVHEILQSIVGTDVALGVLPLGTANALASDLGLPLSPVKAAQSLLSATRERIPVGRIWFHDEDGAERSRYFTVAAGIGADAQLMGRLDSKLKRRFGYALYAIEGVRMLVAHSFPLFDVSFEEQAGDRRRVEQVSQLLAVRIRDFGGMLHHFAPGATLRKETLRLVAFKTRNRFDYARFLAAVVFRRHTFHHRIELLDAVSVECRTSAESSAEVFVEADGELLGKLPVRIEIVPDALTVLVPPQARL
jgi:diacylglycerol kinase (ATP)